MDYQIKGKLAFVTAGAHGIGEAIANLLAQEGVGVIVADQDEAALKAKGGAWRATFAANLATAEGMDEAISHMVGAFGRAPDILVNNLGLADPIPFESFSDEQWTRAVDINLMGCVRTCRALSCVYAAPYMPRDLTYCVLNMSQFDKCDQGFKAARENGSIELVIHRSSMGSEGVDSKYKERMADAGECGLMWGA